MPQLDRVVLGTTIFWFLVSYFSLYLLIVRNILPNILKSIKYKEKKIKRYSEGREGNQRKLIEEMIKLKVEEVRLYNVNMEKYIKIRKDIKRGLEVTGLVEEIVRKEIK